MEVKSFCNALKEERLRREFSLDDIAARSNIPFKVLDALESGEFGQIPGRVYLRSFLRSYLKAVGTDERDFFLKHHLEIDALTREDDVQKVVCFSKLKYRRFKSKRIVVVFWCFVFVALLLLMSLPQAQPIRNWLRIPENYTLTRLLGL